MNIVLILIWFYNYKKSAKFEYCCSMTAMSTGGQPGQYHLLQYFNSKHSSLYFTVKIVNPAPPEPMRNAGYGVRI